MPSHISNSSHSSSIRKAFRAHTDCANDIDNSKANKKCNSASSSSSSSSSSRNSDKKVRNREQKNLCTLDDNNGRYWLDGSVSDGLAALISINGLAGHVVNARPDRRSIYMEEPNLWNDHDPRCGGSKTKDKIPLTQYISKLSIYTERECRYIFRRIVNCILVLHEQNVAHRNLSIHSIIATKNLLVTPEGTVQLRDFKNATHFPCRGSPITMIVPSNQCQNKKKINATNSSQRWLDRYASKAPELDVCENSTATNEEYCIVHHDESIDIWGLGYILYILLTGVAPFRGDSMRSISCSKKSNIVDFDVVIPSCSAQNLVRSMLKVDPGQRLTVQQIKESEWMLEKDKILLQMIYR